MDDRSVLALLPDDALLAVLAYLPPREVLGCRVVCRRLRDLCLHRDLWRHVRLRDGVRLKCAALLLTPRLREVRLAPKSLQVLAPLLPDVHCVVSKLSLVVEGQASVRAAVDVVCKLSTLGGLKSLAMDILNDPSQDLAPLLRMVHSARNLRELDIVVQSSVQLPGAGSWSDLEGTSSLIRLDFMSPAADHSFLQSLLRTHAATLEHVFVSTLPNKFQMPVLMNSPRLRSLSCNMSIIPSDSRFLVNLKELCLIRGTPNVFPSELLGVLQQARHLRRVVLPVPETSPNAPLLALARSHSASVLVRLGFSGALDLAQLAASLPRFPSLQYLSLGVVPTVSFLRAVSPASAPSLTWLRVFRPADACFHEWLHEPVVADLLARNPRLHLHQTRQYFRAGCQCQWCDRGCHAEVKRRADWRSAFAMHQRMPDCPESCFQLVLDPPPAGQ